MCLELLGPAIEPPTEKAATYVKVLKALCFFEVFVGVSGFATQLYNHAIIALIMIMLLFCAWRSIDHTLVSFYIYLSIIMYITAAVFVFGKVQNSLDVCQPGVPCGRFVLSCIYFCYYVTTSIVCFFIYREFKAIKYDQDPRMRDFFAQAEQQRQQQRESNNDMNDENFAPNYGGRDKQLPPLKNNRKKPESQEYFQGHAVVIG